MRYPSPGLRWCLLCMMTGRNLKSWMGPLRTPESHVLPLLFNYDNGDLYSLPPFHYDARGQ